ncbi:MAG: hypothetical protein DWQ01_18075 [Planctomycetota bacterium]|nr:MAG: hypothetical protein DWQ01_18075 [Planctomycetota bacterium]
MDPTFLGVSILAALVGASTAFRFGRRHGRSWGEMLLLLAMAGIAAVLGGHLFAVVAYKPAAFAEHPFAYLFDLSNGLSLAGALFFFFLQGVEFSRLRRQAPAPNLDLLAVGAAPSVVVSRLYCWSQGDHPGLRYQGFPAIEYPDGLRLDLGMLEALWGLILCMLLWRLASRLRPGGLAFVFVWGYAAGRLILDSLRIEADQLSSLQARGWIGQADPRYGGLTPAQWLAIVSLALSFWAWRRWRLAGRMQSQTGN